MRALYAEAGSSLAITAAPDAFLFAIYTSLLPGVRWAASHGTTRPACRSLMMFFAAGGTVPVEASSRRAVDFMRWRADT